MSNYNKGMGFKQEYENRIMFWVTVVGTTFATSITINSLAGSTFQKVVQNAVIITAFVSLIVLTIVQQGEIKDLKQKINKERRDENVYEQKQ